MTMRSCTSALLLLAGVAACSPKPVPLAPAHVPPAAPRAAVEGTGNTTAVDGWRPPAAPAASQARTSAGADAARARFARGARPRVLVYYNSNIASAISGWHTPSRDVIEMSMVRQQGAARQSSNGRITLSTEYAVSPQDGGRDIDELLSTRLEMALTRALLDVGTTVVDRNLLFRLRADKERTTAISEAELRALQKDVDLVIEATFVPVPESPEGMDVRMKALATNGARVLSMVSSLDVARSRSTSSIEAVAGRGYETVTRTTAITLEQRLRSALDQLLGDVATRY